MPSSFFYDPVISLAKRLSGRSFILSYPKSGRTWILNVCLNYWWRNVKNAQDPLPFHLNLKTPEGQQFQKETGISFSHGARLAHLRKGGDLTVRTSDLRMLPMTLLIRNPVSVLTSYYHHQLIKQANAASLGTLNEFVKSKAGLEAYTRYHNTVIPLALQNRNANIIAYEDLHMSSANRNETFEKLFKIHFKHVCKDALEWAIEVCESEPLRDRTPRTNTRIRKADIRADDQQLTHQLRQYIVERSLEGLSKAALTQLSPLLT